MGTNRGPRKLLVSDLPSITVASGGRAIRTSPDIPETNVTLWSTQLKKKINK